MTDLPRGMATGMTFDADADVRAWGQANPGLGIRISVDHVANEQRSMTARNFATERLGVGDLPATDEQADRVIPAEPWRACADPASGAAALTFDADDLVAWLREQIAEDERKANAASIGSPAWRLDDLGETVCWWLPSLEPVIKFEREHGLPLSDHWSGMLATSSHAPHIATWDPARVLAECEAKRQLIEVHRLVGRDDEFPEDWPGTCAVCGCSDCEPSSAMWPCLTVRLLALPFSDRDGYREEWRP